MWHFKTIELVSPDVGILVHAEMFDERISIDG